MTDTTTGPNTPSRKWSLVRPALWAAGAVIVIAALGFFVVPPVAMHYTVKILGETLGRPVKVGAIELNPFSLTVQVRGIGLSGLEAEQILRHTYKIQCELSDAYNLLFIISFADTGREAERLLAALRALADRQPVPGRVADLMLPAIPPAAMVNKAPNKIRS